MHLEDDPLESTKLRMILNELDFDLGIHSFENGRKAWEYLEANTNMQPRWIMIDLKMPVMNGFEFLEKLKAHLTFRKIPVIVLTTSDYDPDVLYSFENQVAGYFVKPYEWQDFKSMVAQIINYWNLSKMVLK